MYEKQTKIFNRSGLHARPASVFVENANKFESSIEIARVGDEENSVNAKSMVLLLTLGLCQGEEAVITATGADEKEAVNSLVDLIKSGFGEL